ncbi:hypothetical protein WA026_006425 [Henosepilachna vigintioctopunctata]|uniref:Translation initiation factor eIF2B subunit epsilon n=1 Tax=Henosepilachna vigintioctopunctata TaxID=420089 RepID=A0AAW1TK37_9CUCU
MYNKNEIIHKGNIVQAVVVADEFEDKFIPITNEVPMSLLPLLNKPLLDYTLEFLYLGGVEETFLFCCSQVDMIKEYIRKSIEASAAWSLNMKIHILVSESCRSFGDCLRDLDAKGLLRGDFILLEPGVVSNINLRPILKKHKEVVKKDKGAVITIVYQKAGVGQIGRSAEDDIVVAVDHNNRVLYHKKTRLLEDKRIKLPVEIFLLSDEVSMLHNLKDAHIAVCSSSVLPIFSDNFDFQTRDDFIKGLLMNEEIMGSTIYLHLIRGSQYGGAVTNWQNYQAVSWELKDRWAYPLVPSLKENNLLKDNVIGNGTIVPHDANISRCVIGNNVVLGKNINLEDSFIMSNCKLEDNVTINLSVIGNSCTIRKGSKIIENTVLGNGVNIDQNTILKNQLIQATKPDFCEKEDILGQYAFRLKPDEDEDEILQKLPRLHNMKESIETSDDGFSDSDDENLSYTQSPVLDDTKLFFTEVIDSLTRGFEDDLQCDNLILEINSSRYAYNISVKEVNFNVIKAILHMYLRQPTGQRYFSQLLSYFSPILKNYIRNESAMQDCLQAIEDVAITNEELKENWIVFILNWFYNENYLSEESISNWGRNLDQSAKFSVQVKPFLKWLEEADEEE